MYKSRTLIVSHATLPGLAVGDPHTQYFERAGDDITGHAVLDNNVRLDGREAGGTARPLIYVATSDHVQIAGSSSQVRLLNNSNLFDRDAGGEDHVVQSTRHEKWAMKAASETVNNSATMQNDDDLFFDVEANEDWLFYFWLSLALKVASDFKYQFAVPAASDGRRSDYYNGGELNAVGLTNSQSLVAPDTNIRALLIHGVYEGGANAGNVQLQWAQDTAVAEDTIVRAHSHMWAKRIQTNI